MELYTVENLLERMVSINQDLLTEIRELNAEVTAVKAELNHFTGSSYGQMVYEGLNTIERKLDSIDSNTSG